MNKFTITLLFVNLLGTFTLYAQKSSEKMEEFPKKKWTVTASSSLPGISPDRLIDNNTTSTWHTPLGASAPGYPHWFVVDMKENVKVSHVVLHKRLKTGNGFGDFEIWGSKDGKEFVKYGDTYTLDQSPEMDNTPQYFKIKEKPGIRYLKIVALRVTESWKDQKANYTVLAEFGIVGDKSK